MAQNVGQRTGILDKKGFPASLFEAEANLASMTGPTRLPMISKEKDGGHEGVGWPVINPYQYDSAFGKSFAQGSDHHRPTDHDAAASYGKISDYA